MTSQNEKILVIGANGQIGTVLCQALQQIYGLQQVWASDVNLPHHSLVGQFEKLDVLNADKLKNFVEKQGITQIYLLAAILSAKGEQNPRQTWDLNMNALFNVLELAKELNLRVYFPSSIAAFGALDNPTAEQNAVQQPATMYGITKTAGELLAQYYHQKFGLDVRSLRYPGLIGYQSQPGGGTTDYAVHMYFEAINGAKSYTCFLEPNTVLPMMYLDDAIRATIDLMQAPAENIRVRTAYNIQAMSFSPAELLASIQTQKPDFEVVYQPDFRQQIAASWPQALDDSAARADWGWSPKHDLNSMTQEMFRQLAKLHKGRYDERMYL